MYFHYGKEETEYLKRKDSKLGAVIDTLGFIERRTEDDLFSSIVYHITGQQLSAAARDSIFGRLKEQAGSITPEGLGAMDVASLKQLGLSARKAACLKELSRQVLCGAFDLSGIAGLSDEDAIKKLSGLDGVGRWTAEMLLLFCLKRKDVFSYGDLALRRGLGMLYGLPEVTPAVFAEYKKRYSPYGSIASFYIWEVAHGRFPASEQETSVGSKPLKPASCSHYRYSGEAPSPLGPVNLLSDGEHLTALWFSGTCPKFEKLLARAVPEELDVFKETRAYLGAYFAGKAPRNMPPVKLAGTPFQMLVWDTLQKIPYGRLSTYGSIAELIARMKGLRRMSAQAVGGAVGQNPVAILIPCHRVVGKDRSLTGYAGGLDRKSSLLAIESADFDSLISFEPEPLDIL